jgi:uncharacterized membrane protein
MTIPRWWPWAFALSSGLIVLVSLRALVLPLDLVMPNMAHFAVDAPWGLWGHLLGAPLALALAPFQLVPGLRARHPALHRWTGRVYALAVLTAGVSALSMVPTSIAGGFARAGFASLALAWIGTTALGVSLAMRGQTARHRVWMLRSVALTFGAVTLRVYMAPLMASGWTIAETYDLTAWGCWVPNLIVLQIWLSRRDRQMA